eukprot:m.226042 g.226042  ORF g.226042 m.226042 type:complete len:129 (+) comp19219_c0_seq10:2630-3016(+)
MVFFRVVVQVKSRTWSGPDKEACRQILQDAGVRSGFQLGSSKIFIKNPIDCFSLEEQRDDMLDRVVIPIQRGWRAFKVCTSFPRDSNDVALHCVTRQHCIVTPMSALLLGRAYACMLTLLVLWTLLCP